jgi:hypothetical protein
MFNKKIRIKLLIVYVYFQPNSCNTHTEHEWAWGTFLRQWRKVPPAHAQWVYSLELYPISLFWLGIGWYFPGIFPTDTERKLGRDVLVLYIWWEPLLSVKGRLLPPF